MVTEGRKGQPPEWYGHLAASKQVGVPPWDLGGGLRHTADCYLWKLWALDSMTAETFAQAEWRRRHAKG